MINLEKMGAAAQTATLEMSRANTDIKNVALQAIADGLVSSEKDILTANKRDAEAGRRHGLSNALIDRLTLTSKSLLGMAADVRSIAALPDPIGETFDERVLPNGLRLRRQRVPIGVLGVIYESRPNVTIDVSALAVKTGNAALLRGGSETIHSNLALVQIVQRALQQANLPQSVVQFIADTDRKYVSELLRLHDFVEMIIPRGGNSLHRFCRENSSIPVLTGGIGVCHLYVDTSADLAAALPVIENAKVQRPSVCNALDTLLINRSVATELLPQVVARLGHLGVTFRAEPRTISALQGTTRNLVESKVIPAGPDDFDTEWLSLVLSLKVVDDLDEAIDHIGTHGTSHSDGILTETDSHAQRFVNEVDAAAVYVNASTRFTDGAQFGLGAEVAVSTQRLHARGPMGLPELTTYKWVVRGDYTTRS
ncbi:MAG: glutamate-5-semialdehyde dehydrogenase [Anaerolineales bacterium]|nr:glutamate-5-semialdehyde dehydrogenase [Anaerolineales bacterium]